jgi:hypothetical protein
MSPAGDKINSAVTGLKTMLMILGILVLKILFANYFGIINIRNFNTY